MYWFDIADELLPPVYRAIKDLYAYARTLDTELKESLANMMLVRENFFIQTCDLETIEYWESLLGIELYGGETIEDRRQMILIFLNNRFPTSEPYVRHVMETLFGAGHYDVQIDPTDPFQIHLVMLDTTYEAIRRFMQWFIRMCPAHLMYSQQHVENANGEIFVSSISPGQYMARATASVVVGTGSIWLGGTEYSLEMMEL